MRKNAYTLVELMIVIIIIGVLMLAFKNVFEVKNKDNLYGEACINNLYGDVSNFLYAAITSKAIRSGNEQIFPSTYYIEFYPEPENAIRFAYSTESEITTGSYLSLTGTVPQNYNCKTNGYYMEISGQFLQIKINKGLTEDANQHSMSLMSGGAIMNSTFTGEIKFLLKYPGSTGYKELGRFEADIRTQSIKSKMCLAINNTGDCNNRNQ